MPFTEEQMFEEARLLARMLKGFHREPDRGAALIAGALLEIGTLRLLRSFLVDREGTTKSVDFLLPKEGKMTGQKPLGTLGSRIYMCHALGLIHDYEEKNFRLVTDIRNTFAHSMEELSFEDERVRNKCEELWCPFDDPLKLVPEREGVSATRRRFEAVASTSIGSLIYLRSQHFAAYRLRPMVIIGDRSADGVKGPITQYLRLGHWEDQTVKDLTDS